MNKFFHFFDKLINLIKRLLELLRVKSIVTKTHQQISTYAYRIHEMGLYLVNEFNELPPKVRRYTLLAFLVTFLVATIGVGNRIYKKITLRHITEQQAIFNVETIKPSRGPRIEEIMIPGTVEPWHEATIFARSPGYIETWYTDIGARVKAGDLLAVIDAPEIDANLLAAEAELKVAEANNLIAQITDKRWKLLLETDSVSQQDADEMSAAAVAALAQLNAARAKVKHLTNLVDFQSIVAPFDGIISARYIDIGSLINNGGGTTDPRLFDIIQADRLRIYVEVPQYYATRLSEDMKVELHFTEHPGKVFPATLITTADAINVSTRTLLTEFMMENPNYAILPGSYVEVHFYLPVPSYTVRIPINAILFRSENLSVVIVEKDGTVRISEIEVERDFGDSLEVVHGVTADDKIILNPPDSIRNGQKVNIVRSAEFIG